MSCTRAVIGSTYLLNGATATGAGGVSQTNIADYRTYQVFGATTAGAGAATITIEGSNDGIHWDVAETLNLTLATVSSSASVTGNDRYRNIRANITALSGTGATVTATVAW